MKKRQGPKPTALSETKAVPPPAAESSAAPPAWQIADHALICSIGQGAYGEVWLARNVLGNFRAVKIVERRRFQDVHPYEREFNGIVKFEPISRTHPGFVSILHVGRNEPGGYFYYVMELADDTASAGVIDPARYVARTLGRDLTARGRLVPSECAQLGLSLAAALAQLHQRNLIHRDIKPANIIFVDGIPKLADIGLVTEIGEAATNVGTDGYMPPEGPGSPTADLYSLGKVLYQALTGKSVRAFPDLPTHLNEMRDAAQLVRLNEVILRACEIDPRKRFASAEEMQAALTRCAAGPRGASSAPAHRAPSARAESERKIITVLALAISAPAGSDPEEVQAVMQRVSEMMHAIVDQYEGTLIQFLSDGILALFGAPMAHEDHVRRAAHAALQIQQRMNLLRSGARASGEREFRLRGALNTGLAIVGSGDTSAGSTGYTATGQTVNTVSLLLGIAEPGQVLATEEADRGLRDYFFTRKLAPKSVPGVSEPMTIHEVAGAREVRTRMEVGAQRGLTPYVGRSRELALLQERFAEVREGRGQFVQIAGEAGLGKSRLLLEFQRSLPAGTFTWLSGRSISFGQQMAYLPVIDLLRQYFHVEETDGQSAILEKLEHGVRALSENQRSALPYFKLLLASGQRPDDALPLLDAPQRKIETFDALRTLFLAEAERQPLILVVEDLHWTDKASEEFLTHLVEWLALARVLLITSHRPGYQSPFPDRSYLTRLTLNRLSDDESVRLASGILTQIEFPADLRLLLTMKAEGNPFFLEELLKSLLESGALRLEDGRYQVAMPLSTIHVPDTIQDVIMGRIDRLEPSARRALQLASVIGREFTLQLLETISDLRDTLSASLQRLKELELIYQRSVLPEASYVFKHALTQEVGYNSLLLQRRKQLHRLVAATIEELYGERLPEFEAVLAHHYERGEEWERALEYLSRAAARAQRAAARREETALLGRAVAIAERLRLPLQAALLRMRRGDAFFHLGMWAEARLALETALPDLPADRREEKAEVLLGLAMYASWLCDLPGVYEYANGALALAEELHRDDFAARAMASLATVEVFSGQMPKARTLFLRSRARLGGLCGPAMAYAPHASYLVGEYEEAAQLAREAASTSQGPGNTYSTMVGMPALALSLAAMGDYAEADKIFGSTIAFGRRYECRALLARCISMSAAFHIDLFDFDAAEALSEEAQELGRLENWAPPILSSGIDLVFNFARRQEVGRAEALIESVGKEVLKEPGSHEWHWRLRLAQARAEIWLLRGNVEETLSATQSVIDQSHAGGRGKYETLGYWTRGRALHSAGRTAEAIVCLQRALALARKLKDPVMFLRAATALLAVDGTDALLAETQATARRILAAIPNEPLRARFCSAQGKGLDLRF